MKSYPYISKKYSDEIIPLAQMKTWLQMDIIGATEEDAFMGDDQLIKELVISAVDYVETETNLSLGVSEYEWNTPCLPREIRDTFYIKEITSIEGFASTGTTLIENTNYQAYKVSKRRWCIEWTTDYYPDPSLYGRYLIKFKAGFEEGQVPPTILMAIRALVAGWYDNRDDYVAEKKTLADKLLAGHIIPYA